MANTMNITVNGTEYEVYAFRSWNRDGYSLYKNPSSLKHTGCFKDAIMRIDEPKSDVYEAFTDSKCKEYIRLAYGIEAIKKGYKNEAERKALSKRTIALITKNANRHFILHLGPTNSGKTYNAINALINANSGIYLAPLRLMAHETYDLLLSKNIVCNLRTGEKTAVHDNATHVSATIEMVSNNHYDVAVIDEVQMIADVDRGTAWTNALLNVNADHVHVCGSPTTKDILIKLFDYIGCTYEVHEYKRKTKLEYCNESLEFPECAQEGDAFICFSRKNVLACAQVLKDIGIPTSIIYGTLPYETRMEEVRKFNAGETKCLVGTDVIGMGMNLPIRRVIFMDLHKYDGKKYRPLTVTEAHQIAGRAGRYGKYDIGYYGACYERSLLCNKMHEKEPVVEKLQISIPDFVIKNSTRKTLCENIEKWKSANLPSNIFTQCDVNDIIGAIRYVNVNIKSDNVPVEMIYKFALIKLTIRRNAWLFESIIREYSETGNINIDKYNHTLKRKMDMYDLESLPADLDLLSRFSAITNSNDYADKFKEAKEKCSKKLLRYLHSKNMYFGKECLKCGKKMHWSYEYTFCEECFYN